MRQNVKPSSTKNDTKNNQPKFFNSFSRGTIKDPPAGGISDCLADSMNVTTFSGYYEGRTGSVPFGSAEFPRLGGFTGIMAHKVGNRILSDQGDIFTREHVGCYFCWGNRYELITAYVSAAEVTGSNTTARETVAGSIIGSPNILDFHTSARQWLLLIGREFYTAEWNIPAWEAVLTVSRDRPFSSNCDYSEYKNRYVVFNGGGIYKVDTGDRIAFRTNIDPPNIRLLSVAYDPDPLGENHQCRYRYLYGGMRIKNDGGIVNRQTGSVIELETGTNIADSYDIDYAEVGTLFAISPDAPFPVRELWMPIVKNTNPQEYQWHLTHYPVYRTPDLESIDPLDPDKSKYNDPSRFIWVDDVRVCAAFYCRIENDRLYIDRGILEAGDTFNVVELDDGQRFEISEVVSETEAVISTGYYGLSIGPCAGAIGNGRVLRGSVTGDILTRTHGTNFTAADRRKTLYNSDGYRLYITEIIDADNVRVHISGDLPTQGFTLDPTHRLFYDTVTDETLQARKDFYSCFTRYRVALPSCNVGAIFPGFLSCSFRGDKKVFYSHLQDNLDYLIGQHIATQVSEAVQDYITAMWPFQDILSIICANSIWGVPVGLSEFATLPGSNEAVAMLSGVKQVIKGAGCVDYGSITEVEGDTIALITNEQGGEAGRYFNGTSLSTENFLVDSSLGGRIVKAMLKTKRLSKAIYDGIMGLILWRRNA